MKKTRLNIFYLSPYTTQAINTITAEEPIIQVRALIFSGN